MDNTRVFKMAFASVYPHYINKVERKGRTKEELHAIIHWLTGYDERTLQQQIDKKIDLETFFARAPRINPDVSKITGVICGVRVEEIEDRLMRQIRYLDKLVDELAKREVDGQNLEEVSRGLGARGPRNDPALTSVCPVKARVGLRGLRSYRSLRSRHG